MKFIHTVILASNNAHKAEELRRLAAHSPLEICRPADLGLPALDVPEIGGTYLANARLKARAYAQATGLPVLADDSGLGVRALHGQPGVHTARFGAASPHSNADGPQFDLLLDAIARTGSTDRRAWFHCTLVCILPDGWDGGHASAREFVTTGRCRGLIAEAPRGSLGFGYDPILLLPDVGRTIGELLPIEKDRRSHRGSALRRLLTQLSPLMT